jgi:hypothetical protein
MQTEQVYKTENFSVFLATTQKPGGMCKKMW